MPSWELFEKTSAEYKRLVLPPDITARVAIEAGIPMGWERYTGSKGMVIGMTRFGASAPGGTVMKNFGFTAESIAEKAMKLIEK